MVYNADLIYNSLITQLYIMAVQLCITFGFTIYDAMSNTHTICFNTEYQFIDACLYKHNVVYNSAPKTIYLYMIFNFILICCSIFITLILYQYHTKRKHLYYRVDQLQLDDDIPYFLQ